MRFWQAKGEKGHKNDLINSDEINYSITKPCKDWIGGLKVVTLMIISYW
jgi:hypothetical protein